MSAPEKHPVKTRIVVLEEHPLRASLHVRGTAGWEACMTVRLEA
jgi:hypothetical protein